MKDTNINALCAQLEANALRAQLEAARGHGGELSHYTVNALFDDAAAEIYRLTAQRDAAVALAGLEPIANDTCPCEICSHWRATRVRLIDTLGLTADDLRTAGRRALEE